MSAIGVIDYGMGNLHSLAKALERSAGSQRVLVTYDPDKLAKCERLVLPGVGGVRACMAELQRLELDAFVREQATRKPLLGICLGMQVLLDHSEENGGVDALGLIPGKVERFPDPPAPKPGEQRLKVPHMGWNRVMQKQAHPLWEGIPDGSWFYFVHSYYAAPAQADFVLGEATYTHAFAASIGRANVAAFQFHPEKSQQAGMMLLNNFIQWEP